jgi:hypothetical protein
MTFLVTAFARKVPVQLPLQRFVFLTFIKFTAESAGLEPVESLFNAPENILIKEKVPSALTEYVPAGEGKPKAPASFTIPCPSNVA